MNIFCLTSTFVCEPIVGGSSPIDNLTPDCRDITKSVLNNGVKGDMSDFFISYLLNILISSSILSSKRMK